MQYKYFVAFSLTVAQRSDHIMGNHTIVRAGPIRNMANIVAIQREIEESFVDLYTGRSFRATVISWQHFEEPEPEATTTRAQCVQAVRDAIADARRNADGTDLKSHLLSHDTDVSVVVKCGRCDHETEVLRGTEAGPCPLCGSSSYRIIEDTERKGEDDG